MGEGSGIVGVEEADRMDLVSSGVVEGWFLEGLLGEIRAGPGLGGPRGLLPAFLAPCLLCIMPLHPSFTLSLPCG